jgi:Ca-activated chloride channel family protein
VRNQTPALRSLAALVFPLLVGSLGTSFAQTAEDAYHTASSLYVAGKIQEASVEAEEGLRIAPDDLKLGALAELLRKLKDQQRGGQGQGDDKKQDKNKSDDKKQNDKTGDKKNDDKNRDGKNGDQKKDKPDDEKKPGNGESDPNEGKQDGRDEKSPPPEAMSEEDAKRLLNSFADDEKKEQAERRKAIRARAGTEQDW